jgi:cytochrome c
MRTGEALLACVLVVVPGVRADDTPHLGVPATAQELATHGNLVFPDGRGLPAGRGSAAAGATIFATRCAGCHGAGGRGGPGGELAGGHRDLTREQPDRTIGSYWPFATTLFDFVRRAMPLDAPWSLSNDEVYALVAYLLERNGVAVPAAGLDAAALTAIRMPNREGFRPVDAVP